MSIAEIRGVDLHYELLGGGTSSTTPLVWGHGLTSSRASEDEFPLIEFTALAAHRRVLRYDARGHGESGSLTTPREGDWAALGLDQIALVDHLGLDRFVLGGASMGAATALHATLRVPERVSGLVLMIPPTGWETRAAQVDLYEQMAGIVETRGPELLIQAAEATPPPDPFADADEWTTRRSTALRAADPHRLAAAFRGAAVADLPSPDAISTIDTPTLILAWSGDPGHPVSTAERLVELMPRAELIVASTRDELATWTDRCEDFLGRLDPHHLDPHHLDPHHLDPDRAATSDVS